MQARNSCFTLIYNGVEVGKCRDRSRETNRDIKVFRFEVERRRYVQLLLISKPLSYMPDINPPLRPKLVRVEVRVRPTGGQAYFSQGDIAINLKLRFKHRT